MSFSGIRGQDRALEFLQGAVETGKIGHAYIFYGPSGVGKKLAAIFCAKAVNCLAESARPCGVCPSCRKIDSSNHPDVCVLQPEKKGSSIKIDAVRALIKDIGLKPYEGRKKFYIIDQAKSLTEEAANALLKTLEEPPSDSVLILVVEDLESLLATIVSRSQVIKFFPLAIDEVKEILVKDHAIEEGRAHVLSHLSSGRVAEALALSDEKFFAERSKVMAALASGRFFESEFDKISRADLKSYLNLALTWYRDVLVTKATGTLTGIVNIDMADAIAAEARTVTFDRLQNAIRQVIMTVSYVDQNANPKLAMAALGVSV